jgi:hypothetical protein
MPNGRPWTRAEIDLLVEAPRHGVTQVRLAEQLDRTPLAVGSKARKLGLTL